MFIRLNDQPDANNLIWVGFGDNLLLREVIIGLRCPQKISNDVEAAVNEYGHSVKFCWAGMRQDAFLLLKLDKPPYWQAKCHRYRAHQNPVIRTAILRVVASMRPRS